MNKLILFLIISTFFIAGCNKDCPTICKEIQPSDISSTITPMELEQGWYYGSLQKKFGTPDDWIHNGEGTKSAGWGKANENSLKNCDCDKYYLSPWKIKYENIKFWCKNLFSNKKPGIQQIANPASVYCEKNGGASEIRTDTDGSQQGFCKFSDGYECDEWAFYRGECNKTASI